MSRDDKSAFHNVYEDDDYAGDYSALEWGGPVSWCRGTCR
jgi:hypothetical protein